MIIGRYQKINWKKFEFPKAYSFLEENCNCLNTNYETCGSSAISILNGKSSRCIEQSLPKTRKHWSDKALIKYLKNDGFSIIQLTKLGVTCINGNYIDSLKMPINHKHVLICNCLVCKEEASWFIVNNNYIWHNFDCEPLNPLFFVNKPSQSIWLVGHEKWR